MKCVLCKNEIEETIVGDIVFYGGVIENMSPGYGSKHDMETFKICICDDCLSENKNFITNNVDGNE